MERLVLIAQRAESLAERIVLEGAPRNLDIRFGNVYGHDMMAVARKLERDVARPAADVQDRASRPAVPCKQLQVALDDPPDVEPDELRVAPEALVEIIA